MEQVRVKEPEDSGHRLRVVSYGGGVDSTAMILLMLQRGEHIDHVLYAETADWPETLVFVDMFDRWLLEKHGVRVTKLLSKYGKIYDYMMERKLVPSYMFPAKHVERFKISPVEQYLVKIRNGQPVEMNIGIDYDEFTRMRSRRRKWITNRYPLVDARIGRRGAENIIRAAGLQVPPKSGCFFCPFQSRKQWLKLRELHPDRFQMAIAMEENCSNKKITMLAPNLGKKLRMVDDDWKGQTKLDLEPNCTTGYCMT